MAKADIAASSSRLSLGGFAGGCSRRRRDDPSLLVKSMSGFGIEWEMALGCTAASENIEQRALNAFSQTKNRTENLILYTGFVVLNTAECLVVYWRSHLGNAKLKN